MVRSNGNRCRTHRLKVTAGLVDVRIDPGEAAYDDPPFTWFTVGVRRGTVERRDVAMPHFIPGMGTVIGIIKVCGNDGIERTDGIDVPIDLTFVSRDGQLPLSQPPIHFEIGACDGQRPAIRYGRWDMTITSPGYQPQTEAIYIDSGFSGWLGRWTLEPIPTPSPSPLSLTALASA